MAVVIPFVRDFDFAYGRCDVVSPGIRRVVANNPGPFTFTGTGTYIVGHGEVAVIDPGPALDTHLAALLTALEHERVTAIMVTHDHSDHSPLAARLSKLTGAPVYGCARKPHPGALPASGGEEGDDAAFKPDIDFCAGGAVSGPGWTLQAIPTPGHTSNHLCFAFPQENALFTGDHVMGWSTSVVIPPDGDMAAYIASLERVRVRGALSTATAPVRCLPPSRPPRRSPTCWRRASARAPPAAARWRRPSHRCLSTPM
jgi:glyoxylase-like metal-dependent hydrolase (beta-lactamase superfamily II)